MKQTDSTLETYSNLLKDTLRRDYAAMCREPSGGLRFPYLTPGSDQYPNQLWDWDSWLSNVALRQILRNEGNCESTEKATAYERGCVQNFLEVARRRPRPDGWIPILITEKGFTEPEDIYARNMHKPCLAQHAAFLIQQGGGDAEWIREYAYALQSFVNCYRNHYRHECGLYFWLNDNGLGVDNDPCTFGRPPRSSGSIYLNCLMYRELLALAYILDCLQLNDVAGHYRADAESLKVAVQKHCWDERDGFFYSVDLNLEPVPPRLWQGGSGQLRDWPCLIQRIGVWSGFMAMWAEIATPQQATRMAEEHYRNVKTFGAEYGVRSLSKMEKMYNLRASGNPSSWLGPVWGISNYLTFRGFTKYNLRTDALDLAEKTIRLFGRDIERFGALHEYYQPDNGEPILNRGFQNWNYLVLNMIAWREGSDAISEF